MASSYDSFTQAVKVELLASRLYRLLSERFRMDVEAAKLFRRLEQEELEHAARIRLLANQYAQNPAAFKTGIAYDAARIEEVLREGEVVARMLASPTHPMTLAEAKQLMVKLETQFSAAHAELLAAHSDPKVLRFFQMLQKQDRAHAELLK